MRFGEAPDMIDLATVRHILEHNDWANRRQIECAAGLTTEALDRPISMGVGSLRRTLLHIYNGEHVWLQRWKEQMPAWPSETDAVSLPQLSERFEVHYRDRDGWLATPDAARLERIQQYRDSRGGLYRATLGDMIFQGLHHSIHHRAQAVNMLRQVGGEVPEVDFMVWARRPV